MTNASRISMRLAGISAAVMVAGTGIVVGPTQASSGEPVLPAVAAATSAAPVTHRKNVRVRGVRVSGVTVSSNRRDVRAQVSWNRAMMARPGHHDRFNVRLVALPTKKRSGSTVLHDRSDVVVHSANQQVHIALSNRQARTFRAARDVVLSVSQMYGPASSAMFDRGFVTTTQLKQPTTGAALTNGKLRSATRPIERGLQTHCGHTAESAGTWDHFWHDTTDIGPYAKLQGCDLTGANLSGANLWGADLRNAHLEGANLQSTDLRGITWLQSADLNGADLSEAKLESAHLVVLG